jgi:hypothetical protein
MAVQVQESHLVRKSLGMPLSLNCLIHGDDRKKLFIVEIPETKTVSTLKDLIKEKKASRLKDIDASDLDLWQVSFPIDDFQAALENFNLADHLELSPPNKKLTTFFEDVADDHLRVIAKVPGMSRHS